MKKPIAVVLAGGEGKRFAPILTNKTIFPIMGKPWVHHFLGQLERVGFEEILISTSKDNQECIKQYQGALKITSINQPEPLGMANSLLLLQDHLNDSACVVMNAVDLVDDHLFQPIFEQATHKNALLVGMKTASYFPGGYIQINGDRVTHIIEKPKPGEEPSDMVNLVFHYFSQPNQFIKILKSLPDTSDDTYEKALALYMTQNFVGLVPYSGFWSKLKHPHMVLAIASQLLNQSESFVHPTAKIAESAIISGPVVVDEGVVVHEYAVIKGPTYIGKNTIIGNHSLVINSCIESNCVIGAGSEITRSYIGPECMLHHNFVGDSVLEGQINPSYGTTFANLRLDKQTVRLKTSDSYIDTNLLKFGSVVARGVFSGVNCSFMPGTSVGAHARIMPGSVVSGAIPEGSIFPKSKK